MPGLDLSQVSSNWKKLQEKLQAEKKQQPQSNGVKRKRPLEQKTPANVFKKTKVAEQQRRGKTYDRKRMGLTESRPVENPANDRSTLVREHGIAAEDVSAAYGNANGTTRAHQDNVNGGLHPSHKAGKYVGLDCEMVGTGPPPHTDNVLARASLVNFHGEQIYDSYVLPPPGITVQDYRTHVSGIKPSHLTVDYARSFTRVQKDVAELLDGRILVGHALRNDLQALLLSHPKRDLRDTSRHPKFRVESKGKPPALRNLAKSELGLRIQTGEHSSVEDARAAMILFKKEKAGFEDENRRQFGRRDRLDRKDAGAPSRGTENGSVEDDDEEEEGDDDEDLDLLAGEDEVDGDDADGDQSGALKGKKKRKKKKRTKRK